MIALKIKLTQDSVGALHAEFIDGLNSVSQNNAGKNIVEVILNGFELQTEEMLQIAYATSLNENDPMTENIGFNFMEKNYERNSWIAEVDPLVLDRRGVWYLGLRVVTETSGIIQTVSNETDMLEFTVNATLKDANGKYPNKADIFALYQTAVNAVAQSEKVATETAAQVASEVAENVTNEKLTPVIQVTNNELGASLELLLNDQTYELYAILRAKNGEPLGEIQKVDLPLEEMIINAYQNEDGNLVIVLKNGQERTIELGALIKGLVASSEKGQPNGVASLNEQGQIPQAQIPTLPYLPLTGGTVTGDIVAQSFSASQDLGYYVGDTTYLKSEIAVGDTDLYFPNKSGTIALDDDLQTLERSVDVLTNVLTEFGIWYTADDTSTWNERITADGEKVLNNSLAVLKKVVGSTVKCNNLLPKLKTDPTFNNELGIYFQANNDGSIIISKYEEPTVAVDDNTHAVFTVASNILLPIGETFTLSGCPIANGLQLSMRVNKNGDWEKQYDNTNGNPISFTIEEGFEYVVQIYVKVTTFGNVDTQRVIYPMLNKGSSALPYETYFAGLKSASFEGIKTTGKNLFDTSFIENTTYDNGSSVTVNYDGSIRVVKNSGDRIQFRKRMYLPKGVYTISNGLNVGALVYFEVENGGTTISKGAVTFNWNGGYTNLILYSENTTSGVNVTLKPQLEVGDTVTAFERYAVKGEFKFPETDTPLGTTIDFENKKIIEGSKEIVLKGTENWRTGSTAVSGKHRFVYTLPTPSGLGSTTVNCISSVYGANTSNDNWLCEQGIAVSDSNINVYLEAFATKSVDEFKAHLAKLADQNGANNPVTVRYLLATVPETSFKTTHENAGNEYRVFNQGMESVIGNDGAEYGANNTLTVNYIYVEEKTNEN